MVVRRETRREHNPVRASSDGALEKADMLAPPEERVRQAVSMAVNRDEMITATFNGRGGWNTAIPWALTSFHLDPEQESKLAYWYAVAQSEVANMNYELAGVA